MSARVKQNWAALSDIGRVRSHNEDSVLAQPPLFVVADGLGGHEAGEVASSLAVETLRDNAPRRPDANALARAVRAANREVIRAAREGIGRAGMGTTMTAAIVESGRIAIAHVGDSRAYLLHDNILERITEDHSMVADMIRRGQITEEESRVHPNRSVITRALGTDANMVADTYELEARAGDRLLLCSDGLTGMLTDAQISDLLGRYRDPGTAVHALIEAANEAGGHDNITAVVVDIDATASPRGARMPGGAAADGKMWLAVIGWVLALALVIGGIAYGTYSYARTRAFLIAENGSVTIYKGVPGEIAGFSLRWKVAETDVPVEWLPPTLAAQMAQGIEFSGVGPATAKVDELSNRYQPRSTEPSSAPTTPTP